MGCAWNFKSRAPFHVFSPAFGVRYDEISVCFSDHNGCLLLYFPALMVIDSYPSGTLRLNKPFLL